MSVSRRALCWVVLAVFLSWPVLGAVAPESLAAYYSFDSVQTDSSPNGRDLTSNAAPVYNTSVYKLGTASTWGFSASQFFYRADEDWQDAYFFKGGGSVRAWVYRNADTAYQSVLGKRTTGNVNGANNILYWRDTTYNLAHSEFQASGWRIMENSGGAFSTKTWTHVVMNFYTNGTLELYQNGVLTDSATYTGTVTSEAVRMQIGYHSAIGVWSGNLDDIAFWNTTLSTTQILDDYNGGLGCDYSCVLGVGNVSNFTVTGVDVFSSVALQNFTVRVSGPGVDVNFSGGGGSVVTSILSNATSLYNVTVWSNDTGGYYARLYENYNVSSNLYAELTKYYRVFSTSFTNVTAYNGSNYTRLLRYTLNVSCPSFSTTTIVRYVGGSPESESGVACPSGSVLVSGSYVPSAEGLFSMAFYFNTSYAPSQNNVFFGNQSFIGDLYAPSVALLNFSVTEGFVSPSANVSLRCTDSVFTNLTYNLTFNGVGLLYANRSNGSTQSVVATATDGTNTAAGVCSDPFGSASSTVSNTVYWKVVQLIDERSNSPFDVANITSARAYFDDNSTYYDFTGNGTYQTNFTSLGTDKVRVELTYSDGKVITRYVDVSLLSSPIRVCANKEGVTHYEQLIISAQERPTVLKNVFSNCVIAADYTRFAYQDAFLLKAFSIQGSYYLYTYVDDVQTFLASVDGSVASYVNLDTLEFKQQGYNLNILQDALSFEKTGDTEVTSYYENIAGDNTALNYVIVRMDTNTVVFNTSDFADPDSFTVVFDYSMLNNVTNETLFYGLVTATNSGGTTTIKRYFNTNASRGVIRTEVAFVIAIILSLFGLTFTASRFTFGWFGLIVILMALAVLSVSIWTWYTQLFGAVLLVIAVYITILLFQNNQSTVA